MITGTDFYHVMTAVVPLYVAMILAYGSVKWWGIFTPDQCSGINRFVALFAVPLLSFHFISTNNPYTMNLRFIAADTLQKLMMLAMLTAWSHLSRRGSLEGALDRDTEAGDEKAMTADPNNAMSAGQTAMPPTSVMTRLILIMVWRKLIRNPNTYSSLIGLIWSLVCFRWNFTMPAIVLGSISILSDAGLGMAMFSLGLFMALQPRIIACGNKVATYAMAVRFLAGPAVMTAASFAVGLRGTLLHVAIVQAALPQGIVPFVFAKEYSVHPDILSTAVIFGMLIALPITLVYYILLGL
ncbi:unnamed protein product [Triticum turgidum subsp. durum]|uniref:Auxin efflux carrier component n=1 Tax=Triticum turgidum subsp. durum TaxID=4567 RepID=A0A9R0YSG3_TRITD|nr:unnamed protein product [Triticum turgidum subsp. durum]